MKFVRPALLFLVASVPGCGRSSAPVPAEPTNAEYQVLSAYLSRTIKADARGNKLNFVIASDTAAIRDEPQGIAGMYKLVPTLKTTYQEVFRSFLDTNHHSSHFRSSFDIPIPYQIIESSEMQTMQVGENFWGLFYQKYPQSSSLLKLSRVGFNRDGTQAAFYTSMGCGSRCGRGFFVIMQKAFNSDWKIVLEVQLWVS